MVVLRIVLQVFFGLHTILAILNIPLLFWGEFMGFPFIPPSSPLEFCLRFVESVIVAIVSYRIFKALDQKAINNLNPMLAPIILSAIASINLLLIVATPTGYNGPRYFHLLQLFLSLMAIWVISYKKKTDCTSGLNQ